MFAQRRIFRAKRAYVYLHCYFTRVESGVASIFSFETTIVSIGQKSSVTKMSGLLVDYWITGLLNAATHFITASVSLRCYFLTNRPITELDFPVKADAVK